MIVSNLKMAVEPLAAQFYAGDSLALRVAFFQIMRSCEPRFFKGHRCGCDPDVETGNPPRTTTVFWPATPVDGLYRDHYSGLRQVANMRSW